MRSTGVGVPFSSSVEISASHCGMSVSAGAYVYTFGNSNKAYNDGDDPRVVGTWSLNMTY